MKSVAVIGQGFVGGTLTTVLAERGVNVHTFDTKFKIALGAKSSSANLLKLVDTCEADKNFSGIYFVCVPTPMNPDGSADISIVSSILNDLANIPGDRMAVVKSTVPPGSTEKWNEVFEEVGLPFRVVFCPEFLTEANAIEDMRHQNRIILGGPRPWINRAKQVFQSAFPKVPIIKTSSTVAEMVKYFTNIHLATRVVLSCELWQLCEVLDQHGYNIDYDKVVEYAKYDARLGGSHMSVPGNDGIPGARGHCFPKDLAALASLARQFGVAPKVMEAVQEKNLEVVPAEGRDWEKMVGRAVNA
jgi:UDPglucose 6-dehydrogenase